MRKAAIACGAVGLVLLVAAALLAFWISPSYIARLPSSSNTVRDFTGKVQTLVNPKALATGNFAGAISVDLPLSIRQQVKVLQTSGNTALVRNSVTADTSGRQLTATTYQYALDRKTFEATSSHPSNWSVSPATGLTVNWPIGTKKQNYTGWVDETQSTVPLKYVKQTQHGGVNTYEYTATVPTTPMKGSEALKGMPKSLPVHVLDSAAKAGLVSKSLVATFARLFPHATSVPLGYTYASTNTYWVAPATGEVIDVNTSERRLGGLALPGGKIVPVLPVLADTYSYTSSSVKAAANDANNDSSAISAFGTIIPIAAAAVGLVLLIIAALLWFRARNHTRPAASPPPSGPAGPPRPAADQGA